MPPPIADEADKKNNRMIQYNILSCNVFADTLISSTVSKRGNKYEEVFATDFGWAQAYPMENKSDAYEALSLIFSGRVFRIILLFMDQRKITLEIF